MADDETWVILETLRRHIYQYDLPTSKPDSPGWNACTCGWEGYWCDFHPHLSEEISSSLKETRHG